MEKHGRNMEKVLIVDDLEVNRLVLAEIIREIGRAHV